MKLNDLIENITKCTLDHEQFL